MKKKTIETKMALWGCLGAILLSLSCACLEGSPIEEPNEETPDEQGVVIRKTPIWEKDISERERVSAFVIPIFHQEKVIVPGSQYHKGGMLVALDTASGEEVWRWDDYIDGYNFDESLSREQLNRKGNLVIYKENNGFCAVDLDKGKTLWKDNRKGSSNSSDIQIVGEHYYYSYKLEKEKGVNTRVLMRGDIHSTDHEELIELPIERIQLFGSFYGTFHISHVYTEKGITKAFIPFSENLDIYKSQSFKSYISYNISSKTYDFEKVRLPDTLNLSVITRPVKIRDKMIVSAGDFIYGVNRHTGKLIWTRKEFAGKLSNGRLMTAGYKNRLFAANHNGSRRLAMELDPDTGKTLWIDAGNGGSIRPAMYFLNDVLYFVSRGDGRLYAYDINTGKMLWKLRSDDDESFTVMQVRKAEKPGETDMLVACTWKNAYRFKPAR